MKIHSYGVFVNNAIPYLHQSKNGVGVDCLGQNLPSPFELDLPVHLKRYNEPHNIELHPVEGPVDLPEDFLNNALVDLYLPKPVIDHPPAIVFIKDKTMDPFSVLKKLAALSSMTALSTVIYEVGSEDNYRNQLKLTNLGPLTLVGVTVKGSQPIFNVTEYAKICMRNLVITGHPDIPTPKDAIDYTEYYHAADAIMKTMEPGIDFRMLGAQFFKKWMQHYHTQETAKCLTPSDQTKSET